MMDVYIYVQNSNMIFKKFKDPQNKVIDITKTRSLAFFGMMQTTRPIDSYVTLSII